MHYTTNQSHSSTINKVINKTFLSWRLPKIPLFFFKSPHRFEIVSRPVIAASKKYESNFFRNKNESKYRGKKQMKTQRRHKCNAKSWTSFQDFSEFKPSLRVDAKLRGWQSWYETAATLRPCFWLAIFPFSINLPNKWIERQKASFFVWAIRDPFFEPKLFIPVFMHLISDRNSCFSSNFRFCSRSLQGGFMIYLFEAIILVMLTSLWWFMWL